MLHTEYMMDADELEALARAGAERARSALQTLLGERIEIVETRAWTLPGRGEDIIDHIAPAGNARLGRLGISGPPDGAAWVAVPTSCVSRLMERFGVQDEVDDATMSGSVVAEVANIVTGSYVTELGDRWGLDLDPTPADLGLHSNVARRELDLLRGPGETLPAIAVGCGFADADGIYDISVVLMLDSMNMPKPTAAPEEA